MSAPRIQIRAINPQRGVVDAYLWPTDGAPLHHIGYLRAEKPPWFCVTCGPRCPWIKHIRQHPDVPDMEGI